MSNTLEDSVSSQLAEGMVGQPLSKQLLVSSWKLLGFKVLAGCFLLCLVGSIYGLTSVFSALSFEHPRSTYGVDKNGRIQKTVPMDRPNMKDERAGKLFANFVEDTLSFDWVQYKSQLNAAGADYFTSTGFTSFATGLKRPDGFLDFVKDNHAITITMARGVPEYIGAKVWNGRYAWKFKVIVVAEFISKKKKAVRYFELTSILVRQPINLYEYGIAIETFHLVPVNERDL